MGNTVLTVGDVYSDVGRVLGTRDSTTIYSRINDIVEILASESDWDPTRGCLDVWVGPDRTVTLPEEVDVVLAVNVNGRPTQMHDWWFRFHLNGPGDDFGQSCDWAWWSNNRKSGHVHDDLQVCVFQDPPPWGISLVAQLETAVDSLTPFRVFGYDGFGNWIRSVENGIPVDGFLVPTMYGAPAVNLPIVQISAITRIQKLVTTGYIGLWAINPDGSQAQLGNYSPTETNPRYRRIQIDREGGLARVAFKRRMQPLSQLTDIIFLSHRYAIITMAKALQKIDENRIQEAELYHQLAVRFMLKKQLSVSVPAGPSIQIADNNLIADKRDRME